MKERPIIFSGEMVRAILEGRKTQTRRVVKPQPWPVETVDTERHVIVSHPDKLRVPPCPYGQPGDRLWVRETWWHPRATEAHIDNVAYRADGEMPCHLVETNWRPSIHMPRWASRILLEVTDVRVERVQDISEADVQAEGCTGSPFGPMGDAVLFPRVWDSINAKRGHDWDTNPWVWVVSFRVLEP